MAKKEGFDFTLKLTSGRRILREFEINQFTWGRGLAPLMYWHSSRADEFGHRMLLQNVISKVRHVNAMAFYKKSDSASWYLLEAKLKNLRFEQIILSVIQNRRLHNELILMGASIIQIVPVVGFPNLRQAFEENNVFAGENLGYDLVAIECEVTSQRFYAE